MRVLLMEREAGTGGTTAAALTAGDHQVVRCHEPGDDTGPCAGMPGEHGCPLDRWPVDVALSVRATGGPSTEAETGMRCAIRQQIPVMVVGEAQGAGYADWVRATVAPDDPALDQRVTEVGRAGLEPAEAAVRDAVTEVLVRHGVPSVGVDVNVTHTDTRLRIAAYADAELDPRVAHAAAVRAVAAMRDLMPWFDRIDVDVSGPDGLPHRVTP